MLRIPRKYLHIVKQKPVINCDSLLPERGDNHRSYQSESTQLNAWDSLNKERRQADIRQV